MFVTLSGVSVIFKIRGYRAFIGNYRYCSLLAKTLLADKNNQDASSHFPYSICWIIFSKKVCFQAADQKIKKKGKIRKRRRITQYTGMKFATVVFL